VNATTEQVRQALLDFDSTLRKQPEWSNWVDKQSYKYAIFNDDKIYPVKEIVSMVTGYPNRISPVATNQTNFVVCENNNQIRGVIVSQFYESDHL